MANPNDARALVDRGDALVDLNKQRDSIRDYTAALAINPQYAYALASRCDAYFQIDENQSAVADCDKAISLKKTAYAFRVRALALDALGEQDKVV